MSNHFSEICNEIWSDLKFTVLAKCLGLCHGLLLALQQKPDILVAFTNSVLHQSVQSEFMSQTSKLVFLDISIVSIFTQFV